MAWAGLWCRGGAGHVDHIAVGLVAWGNSLSVLLSLGGVHVKLAAGGDSAVVLLYVGHQGGGHGELVAAGAAGRDGRTLHLCGGHR